MVKRNIEPAALYQMYVIEYLEIFASTAGELKKMGEKKYFSEIKKAFLIALNNNYTAPATCTKNDLLLFTMNNYYSISELGRLTYELYIKKILNKKELNILSSQLKKFKRKSNHIINNLIRESGYNMRRFV